MLALAGYLGVVFAGSRGGCWVIYQLPGAVDLSVVVIVVIATGVGRFGLRMGESKKKSAEVAEVRCDYWLE